MIKLVVRFLYVLVALVLVASCSSTRKLEKTPMIGGLTGEAYMEKVIELSPSWKTVSGKVALTLNMEGQKDAKVSATLRLKRGESIQLLVAPLLGIEVARLEITPGGLLAVDRLNKRYVNVSFEELSRLANTDLSFNILQSLFLNELFLPGKVQLDVSDAKSFRISLENGYALLEAKPSKGLSYRFRTSADRGLLEESRIGVSNTPYALNWKYDDFTTLDNRLFPSHMLLAVEGTGKTLSLDMKFSRLSVGGDWEGKTELSSRYQQIELQELLKTLFKQ